MLKNTKYSDLNVGDTASLEHTVKERDIQLFALCTGDINPIHVDKEFAKTQPYGQQIAHGMWTGSLISTLLATKLPGPGGVYRSQNLKFKKPVFIGDTLTASVTVTSKRRGNLVELDCQVSNQNGVVVAIGTCSVTAVEEDIELPEPHLPEVEIRS